MKYSAIAKLHFVCWYPVSWLNSELAPPPTETPRRVLCVNQPGMWTDGHHSALPDLVGRYCSEALHNLFCHRLFVWEQVRDELYLLLEAMSCWFTFAGHP